MTQPIQDVPGQALSTIAIAGRQRASILPELSTFFEKGFPEIDSADWYGLLAPAGTPAEAITRLHAALNATLKDASVRARLMKNRVEIETSPAPADFGRFVTAERERWGPLSVVPICGRIDRPSA